MKWNNEKVEKLKDCYAYMDLDVLASQLDVTKKAIIRKAQKLKLYRAKNNQIIDEHKFCSLCQTEHHISQFYRNRAKYDGYEYYCIKYYKKKKERATTPPSESSKKSGASTTEYTCDYVTERPRNPSIFQNGIEGKICNACKDFKPLESYSVDRKGYCGRKATCKQCYKERYSRKRVG